MMKTNKSKNRSRVAIFLCMACLLTLCACAKKQDEMQDAKSVLSPGVQILSAATEMAVWGLRGNDVTFEAEDFSRNLNLSSIQYIKVISLPTAAEGELLMGSVRVSAGQIISGENLTHLCFSAADDTVTKASFSFSANGNAAAITCNVHLLNGENYAPTVSLASSATLEMSTYRDREAYGRLSAYDPDGDAIVFEIVKAPANGSVLLSDRAEGTYVYTPRSGFVGSDEFSYVARDVYGNYSTATTVKLRIMSAGTAVTYVDMANSKAANAALALTEAGVMSGVQVGNQHFFYPERTVTRAELLVMAMNAAGITDVPACEATGFDDDADIPTAMKGYVAAAYSMGYISGFLKDGKLCFLPNEEITRAEAAVMICAILGEEHQGVIPTFADGAEIPVWAQEAIYTLNVLGVMDATDGYIAPSSTLSREQAALILQAVMRLK
ncbi:MAG: S-layer homology domain-containing protein [Clostridia bacterium]|nr:S-layer homology domain-containing protein [Clostridia bacterium]